MHKGYLTTSDVDVIVIDITIMLLPPAIARSLAFIFFLSQIGDSKAIWISNAVVQLWTNEIFLIRIHETL